MDINKNSAFKIKNTISIVLGIIIILLVSLFCSLNLLFTERFPDEEMQAALHFLKKENYIGMTIEECEAILGEYDREINNRVICYSAGRFYLGLTDNYELYIYFDENGLVKTARIKEAVD